MKMNIKVFGPKFDLQLQKHLSTRLRYCVFRKHFYNFKVKFCRNGNVNASIVTFAFWRPAQITSYIFCLFLSPGKEMTTVYSSNLFFVDLNSFTFFLSTVTNWIRSYMTYKNENTVDDNRKI